MVGVGGRVGFGVGRRRGGRGCGSFMNFLGGFVAGWRGWCVWWQFYVGVGFAFGLARFVAGWLRGETEVFVDGMLSLVGTVVKEI